MTHHQVSPSALLLIAPACPHCPSVLESLGRLLKEGKLGRLEIVNLAEHPEVAEELGVRSVPWMRIGTFELSGNQSYGELRQWAEDARSGMGATAYYQHLLESQQLDDVIGQIRQKPDTLLDLVVLLASLETPMAVRIGIGAVMEEFAGSELLESVVPELIRLTRDAESQIRADACHYLSLSGTPEALEAIRPLLEDENAEVREIAMESIAILEAS
ncbi:MAG: HEAT repeat domain-containing protein [Sedimenticola sp.]